MAGTEAKIIWSIFVHSGYKKGIDENMFDNQMGSSQVGCEKVVHQMKLAGEIYDNVDRCFPDAEKAYYNAARITV